MSRRPRRTVEQAVAARLGTMAPGGRLASESPVRRHEGALRVPRAGGGGSVAVARELAEVMLLTAEPGGNTWGTSGGAPAEPGDVAVLWYAWPWQSSSGANLATPAGWTALGTWTFQQLGASTVYICLTVVYQEVGASVAAGTWETSQAFPYFLNGSTYTGAGRGFVLRGNTGVPVLLDAQTDMNAGRVSMLPVTDPFGLQVITGQTAVSLSTGARLVSNPDSSASLLAKGSGQTIRSASTRVATGPLAESVEVYGETIRPSGGSTYVEESYNYMRVSVGWSA